MPEGSGLMWAAGAFVASEALGVTNFTGGGGDREGRNTPSVPQLPGGGNLPDIGIELPQAPSGGAGGRAALAAQLAALQGRLDSVGATEVPPQIINLPDTIPEGADPRSWVGGSSGSVREWLDPGQIPGSGGSGSGAEGRAESPGFFEGLFGFKAPDPAAWVGDQTQGAGGFLKENPYFAAGTTIGAASPDPITTLGGALVGGVAEIGVDTLTGNTPLGVQSPIDVTSGGAWWQGPDPLNLGPSGGSESSGSGAEGRPDNGTPERNEPYHSRYRATGNKVDILTGLDSPGFEGPGGGWGGLRESLESNSGGGGSSGSSSSGSGSGGSSGGGSGTRSRSQSERDTLKDLGVSIGAGGVI